VSNLPSRVGDAVDALVGRQLSLRGRLLHWSEHRLDRQLTENARIAAEVWTTPTVAEQYGLLPLSAWVEWRQGNADATD